MSGDVTTKHEKYVELAPRWTKTRVVDKGEDEVHEAGVLLLPRLEQQSDTMYKAYKERTRFLPAFHRTTQGLQGTVTRKDPIYNVDEIEDLVDNITSGGVSLEQYYKMVLNELLTVGVCGTLVDHVPVETEMTVAEAEESNLRPNFAFYKAESIINWKYDTINNSNVLVMVVLKEVSTAWENEFETKEQDQYRVLKLDEEGYYYQELHKEDSEGQLVVGDTVYPLINNEKIKEIPLFLHGLYENPPLYDLVTTNVKHYQLKADHNHALHYIGLPTPIFPGVDPDDPKKPQAIGPEQIVYISNPQAKPFYLTYGGEGLVSIEVELKEIEAHMAFLGANMLAPADMVAETATKATFRRASETSALAIISENASLTLTEALQFMAVWNGTAPEKAKEEVSIQLSKDFNPVRLAAQDIVALVSSWQSGAITKEVMYWNFQQGEIIPGENQFEDDEETINNQMPQSGGLFADDEEELSDEEKETAEKKAAEEAAAAKAAGE